MTTFPKFVYYVYYLPHLLNRETVLALLNSPQSQILETHLPPLLQTCCSPPPPTTPPSSTAIAAIVTVLLLCCCFSQFPKMLSVRDVCCSGRALWGLPRSSPLEFLVQYEMSWPARTLFLFLPPRENKGISLFSWNMYRLKQILRTGKCHQHQTRHEWHLTQTLPGRVRERDSNWSSASGKWREKSVLIRVSLHSRPR